MAFTIFSLGRLAAHGDFTLWHYKTSDATETILAEGYFNGGAAELFHTADILICQNSDHPLVFCLRVTGGSVTAAPLQIAPISLENLQPPEPVEEKPSVKPKRK